MSDYRGQLLDNVTEHLKYSGMSGTQFGRFALGDPTLVRRLKRGAHSSDSQINTIYKWLTAYYERELEMIAAAMLASKQQAVLG